MGQFGATELVDTTSGNALATLPGDKTGAHYSEGAAFTPDSKSISILMDTGVMTAYDFSGKVLATVQTDTTNITYSRSTVFSLDGSLEALQIASDSVEMVDVEHAKSVGTVKLTLDANSAVVATWFSPDRKLIAFLVNQGTLQLWGVSG